MEYSALESTLERLADQLEAVRPELDRTRRLPEVIAQILRDGGLGRLVVDRRLGGQDVEARELLAVLRELAALDASVALTVWNNALPALVARHLPARDRDAIFAGPAALYANSTRPSGRIVAAENGCVVSGRWTLVTGCQLADWFALMCLRWDPSAERPLRVDDGPHMAMAFIPSDQVTIVETWNGVGVRGSGSHDVVVDDVTVRAEHVADFWTPPTDNDRPTGRMRWSSLMAAGMGAVSLGIAQECRSVFTSLVADARSTDSAAVVAEQQALQIDIADADARVRAAQSFLDTSIERAWSLARDGQDPPLDLIADLYAAARHAGDASTAYVSACMRWGGTAALDEAVPLERCWRDVHAVNRHVIVGPLMAAQTARVRLGFPPTVPLYRW